MAYLKWQSEWTQTARPNQIPPEVDPGTGEPWLEFGAMSGRGWGKALDIDTPVPVPSGWRAMRDIRVGDKVVGSDGSLVNVTFVSPVMLDRECYRIVWSDGAEIVADAEHQWSARSRADRRAGRGWRVVTTQEMARARQRVGGERQWQTPGPPVARFAHADLPVDPWLLGFWLGDGDSAGSMLTVGREDRDEVLALCEGAGRTYREAAGENRYTCAAAAWGTRCATTGRYTTDDSFNSALRRLGLLRNKHIPVVFKRAAVEQRERLLAGLVDSDGYVEHATGRIEITTTRRALADDIAEVARSLGHRARVSEERATLNGRDVGPKHRVRWVARSGGGLMARKRLGDRSRLGQPDRVSTRYIDRIERVDSRPVRCIAVDAPDHLYVAGRDWIVTHNTRVGAEWLARAAYEDAEGLPSAVVCPTYGDVKKVAIGGPSGLLSVIPPDLVVDYNKSDFMLTIRNVAGGTSLIQGFSSEKPEGLRGPNHARAWCDEVAAWQNDQDTWDMLEMTLRLGTTPQILWTSTPKPRTLIRSISAPKPGRIIVTGSTYENQANLAPSFLKKITAYEGTKLGEQELHAKLLDAEESGIIKRSQFRIWPRERPLPAFSLIIVSLDTAFTERTRARENDALTDTMKGDPDPTACTVWGVFNHEKRANIMLLDCWDDHLGLPELIRRCKREMQARYGDDTGPVVRPRVGPAHSEGAGRRPDILLIEDKGSGISLRQMLEQEGVIAYPYNPGRADKLTRLHIVSPVFARRLVWLPESSNPARKGQPVNWCETMLSQLCSFTGTGSIRHDDYVDSTSQCLRLCMDKGFLSAQLPAFEQRAAAEETEVRRQLRRPGYNPYAT